jgi:predicted acyl esterase
VYFSSFVEPWGQFTTTLDRNVVPDDLPVWMRLVAKLGRAGVRPVDADRDRSMLFEAVRAHGENYRNFKELSAVIYRDDVTPSGWPVDSESAHRLASDTQASGAAIYSYDGWFDGGYGHAAIKRYLTVQTPGSRLTIGPWTHARRPAHDPSVRRQQ